MIKSNVIMLASTTGIKIRCSTVSCPIHVSEADVSTVSPSLLSETHNATCVPIFLMKCTVVDQMQKVKVKS